MNDLRIDAWDEAEDADTSPPVNGHVVPVDPVHSQWARFRDQFAEAMQDGFWTVEDLEAKILSHRAFFFPGKNCACCGEIVEYPGGAKVMQFTWAVGDMNELVSMEPGVAAICRTLGCNGTLIEGRAGWQKVMKPLGYKPFSVTLYRPL
jgi:hypothetical protein